MPVFDFSNPESTTTTTEVTYTTFHSDKNVATPEDPILLLDNAPRQWAHHSCGVFTNPAKHTAFEFEEEDGITYETPSATSIIVSGINKEEVGDCAARIRATRAPEPYKGKGIRYVGEYVRRKEGKTGK